MTDVPELVIRPLDPASDADMDGFQDVYAASELAEDPDASLYSREDGIAMLTSDTRPRCSTPSAPSSTTGPTTWSPSRS